MFLLAAAVAVLLAQTEASRLAPWLSIGYSAGAVLCTVAAIVVRGRR
jgi:hypothetical protein